MSDMSSRVPTIYTVCIDETLFPLPVVQRTCYQVAGDFYTKISRNDGCISIELTPRESCSAASEVEQNFQTLLSDFALREKIEMSTQTIRDHLVAVALGEVLKKVERQ